MDGCSPRTDRGFTLVELLVAVTLLSVGVAATIGVFGASGRTTLGAQRTGVAVQKAQAEIDKLSSLKYGELALTSTPSASTDPKNPNSRVTGTALKVKTGLNEPLVLTPGTGVTAKVNPGPESFTVGSGGSAITGKIYRFVSWRDEGSCSENPNALCTGTQDTKRVTIAATLDATPTQTAPGPIWVSSVIADKDATPPNSTAAPPTTPTVTAQSFYLYDSPCGQSTPQPQSGSHPTRDTAAAASSACENADPSQEPDLMTPSLPEGLDTAALYDYSSDLTGERPGGLALVHQGTTCSTSYPAETGTTGGLTKWNLHAWSTSAFAGTFRLDGQVTLSLFATTVGAASGRGVICASLLDRAMEGGVPQDRLLGSHLYDISNWPSTTRRLTFTFDLSQAEDVAAGHRLALVIQGRGESDNDLVLLYGHPLYPSLLEVATSTPLGA
jgi:prepilin-type N-terminal cleavage/methylation domain-containing protein